MFPKDPVWKDTEVGVCCAESTKHVTLNGWGRVTATKEKVALLSEQWNLSPLCLKDVRKVTWPVLVSSGLFYKTPHPLF